MPRDFGRRLPMDSKVVDKIRRSPQMSAEQGSSFMSDWGGSSNYIAFAKKPVEQRVTYFAVQQGYSTVKDISDATGLSTGEVNSALTQLSRDGLVDVGVVTE